MNRGWVIVMVAAFTVVVCGCAFISGIYGYRWFIESIGVESESSKNFIPTSTPVVVRPNPGISANQAESNSFTSLSNETTRSY